MDGASEQWWGDVTMMKVYLRNEEDTLLLRLAYYGSSQLAKKKTDIYINLLRHPPTACWMCIENLTLVDCMIVKAT